jgi:bacillithiol biosynthesis cysteine-adding enzyme BshC
MTRILNTRLYNSFYEDFIRGAESPYKYLLPFNIQSLLEVGRGIGSSTTIHQEVKKILADQNTGYDSGKAKQYISTLPDPKTIVIITGQQLGFLLSPIYTIFKAVTTVKLAEQLNQLETGYNFVPVFWLETEDHDFEEIRHAGIWNTEMKPVRISYEGHEFDRRPVRLYRLEENIEEVIAKLQSELLDTEFSSDLFTKLRSWYTSGATWTDAIRQLFRDLFSATGLLFFEPGTAAVKRAGAEFFAQWFEQIKPVIQAFGSTTGSVESDGYPVQVPDIPGKTYVHYEDDNLERQHIYFEDDRFYLKDNPLSWSSAELKEILRKEPERFSSAVISRPVLQSWLLPVAGYVAGPSEIAYWAQIGQIFRQMNIPLPVVYPRITATLLEPKIERFISRHNVDLPNAALKMKDFIDRHFEQNQFDKDRFRKWREGIDQTFSEIMDYILNVDPTLKSVAEKTSERIGGQIDLLETRLLRAVEERERTLIGHLEQIHASVFPLEAPQERFVSIIYYLNKFGPDFLNRLMTKLESDPASHQIVSL